MLLQGDERIVIYHDNRVTMINTRIGMSQIQSLMYFKVNVSRYLINKLKVDKVGHLLLDLLIGRLVKYIFCEEGVHEEDTRVT